MTRELNGYILVYTPEHPRTIKSGGEAGYLYEHILVAEAKIGRPLDVSEEIHHLDFNKANNAPENLIILSKSAHTALHNWLSMGAPIGDLNIGLTETARAFAVSGRKYTQKINRCPICDSPRSVKYIYCSRACYKEAKGIEVSHDTLQELLSSGNSWVQIGKTLGVSDNGARRIALRLGFDPKTRAPLEDNPSVAK